ncbi:MAG: type II toxin-antitoxin system RelE/ParE family toxin [Bacteroidales bacterium]|nr:type II toxin-antitoxin system RelE/ParE family toxin [Bacteroidales bacterium]
MKLIWDEQALEQLKQVAGYVKRSFGVKRKNVFLREITHATDMLVLNPYMGALDPRLSDRSKSYRSIIVNKLNKMVYYVEDNAVIIIAFWDCRRDADGQTQQLK